MGSYLNKKIILILLLIPSIALADDFDKTDKILFTSLVVAQVTDGLTTAHHLKNDDNYIKDIWAWKYGTNRPSPIRLWATKAVELGIAYYVAKKLPDTYRTPFLIGANVLLFGCALSNEIGFSITY
jgi:hypothetical protein